MISCFTARYLVLTKCYFEMPILILFKFRTTLEGRGADSWWIISRSSQLQWRFDQIIQFYRVQRQTKSICCLCESCPASWTQFELESEMFVSCWRNIDHIIGWFQTLFRKTTYFWNKIKIRLFRINLKVLKHFTQCNRNFWKFLPWKFSENSLSKFWERIFRE